MNEDRYSHGHHESVLRSHRWRTAENSAAFLLPHLRPHFKLLDVGCGPGNITAQLAERLPDGEVVGVDRVEEVVLRASSDFSSGVNNNLYFEVGDAYQLQFSSEQFDVVYAHQILSHLSDPRAALVEMRRVLKPGGVLAIRDADYGAFVWYPESPVLERWMDLYHELTRRNGADADAGRRLKSWTHQAGFRDLAVTSSTWTFESPEEREWWGGLWAQRVRESEFASQAVEYGLTTTTELAEISGAFETWAGEPEGIFFVVHGEVLARR